jgi:hypothetical protein
MSEYDWPNIEIVSERGEKTPRQQIVSERGEKTLAMLASGFVFLLANPEFYSQLVSWRVVIHVPLVSVPDTILSWSQADQEGSYH